MAITNVLSVPMYMHITVHMEGQKVSFKTDTDGDALYPDHVLMLIYRETAIAF